MGVMGVVTYLINKMDEEIGLFRIASGVSEMIH